VRLRRSQRHGDGDRSTPRPPLTRSIRTRLAVTFFLVTALSVLVIYFVVAPPLTSGLRNQEVGGLARNVTDTYKRRNIKQIYSQLLKIPFSPAPGKATARAKAQAQGLAKALASETVSQVNIVDVFTSPTEVQASTPITFASEPDSDESQPVIDAIDSFTAQVRADSLPPDGTVTGIEPTPRGLLGLVGVGLPATAPPTVRVLVFSVPLNDVGGAVALVRSRILLAAAIGLLVALITGVLVARALTVRVLRLERTAQRVAQGDFGAHFSDSSGDELGQLARELAHMQSQLEGLDAARRRFIATASHELRTPIFSLGGFLELIQDEALDEETRRQFVGQVRDQVDRLGKLATQLLDLTRLESGAVELAVTPTDLGVLARAVTGEFGPALSQHASQLRLRIPAQPVRVVCDGERVGQLLRILIDNALAHTPSGTDMVVSATAPENGTGARLSVSDSGPGIPEDAIGRVFEPFYSADGARGAGLGLAIARELAVHMDAQLEITSVPGSTTFTLTLPPTDA
jgi:two-component system OmpR family sensor kinase